MRRHTLTTGRARDPAILARLSLIRCYFEQPLSERLLSGASGVRRWPLDVGYQIDINIEFSELFSGIFYCNNSAVTSFESDFGYAPHHQLELPRTDPKIQYRFQLENVCITLYSLYPA